MQVRQLWHILLADGECKQLCCVVMPTVQRGNLPGVIGAATVKDFTKVLAAYGEQLYPVSFEPVMIAGVGW
jgi:hypothetical protein